jgi:hypothetical protein
VIVSGTVSGSLRRVGPSLAPASSSEGEMNVVSMLVETETLSRVRHRPRQRWADIAAVGTLCLASAAAVFPGFTATAASSDLCAASSPGPKQVYLYQQVDYGTGGNCIVFAVGDFAEFTAYQIGNDATRSIKAGRKVRATLCENFAYDGASSTFSRNDPDLSDTAVGNDNASSLKVRLRHHFRH